MLGQVSSYDQLKKQFPGEFPFVFVDGDAYSILAREFSNYLTGQPFRFHATMPRSQIEANFRYIQAYVPSTRAAWSKSMFEAKGLDYRSKYARQYLIDVFADLIPAGGSSAQQAAAGGTRTTVNPVAFAVPTKAGAAGAVATTAAAAGVPTPAAPAYVEAGGFADLFKSPIVLIGGALLLFLLLRK